MAANWTTDQQTAIARRGGQILVSAAAGSGKTTVLVARILALLTDEHNPVDADRLLVVTFTNAAAAEMAARIRAALEERLTSQPNNQFLRRQSLLLGRAQISTVHAFCAALLRDHFTELGIPADFIMADDVAAAELRGRALDRAMERLYADPDSNIEALSDLFGRARSDRDTARLIERIYEFESNLAFPKQWESAVLDEAAANTPLAETAVGAALFAHAEQRLQAARGMTLAAMELIADSEALEAAYGPSLTDDLHHINRLLAQISARNWDSSVAVARAYLSTPLKAARGCNPATKNAAQELRNAAKKILQSLPENCFLMTEEDYHADRARTALPQQALFSAVAVFEEELTARKLERRTFEFGDLERYALTLLCGEDRQPTDTARQIAARFDHILVDEYQDTNEIQDLLFQLVSSDGKNLFFVGDVKQSIYSFRRADPALFMARRDGSYANETGLFPARISLSQNFRSAAPVIEAVNRIFQPLMTRQLGGSDYAAPGEALVARDDAPRGEPIGMEVCLLQKEEDSDVAPRFIAAKIDTMLRDGYRIETPQGARPCRPSDFCILLRSAKNRAGMYAAALEQRGLRCWNDGGDNIFEQSEIAVLLAFLRAVDNPRRDADLAAAMLSPLFGFTPDDLARLRLCDRRAPFYTLLRNSAEPKVQAFLATLAELRTLRGTLPVGTLIRQVADRLSAEILLCAGRDYTARRDNLRLLIDYADSYAATTGGSLAAFLRLCESAARSGKGIRREPASPPNAVCITTIHKSKGLEWPIVILADGEKSFNQSDSRDSVMLFDAQLGLGARIRTEAGDGYSAYAHRTLHYAALASAAREKSAGEEMRVLYVALTRARQKLFVTAALSDAEKTIQSWAARANGSVADAARLVTRPIDWIGLAALASCADFTNLESGAAITDGALTLSMPFPPDSADIPETVATVASLPDPALVDAMQRRLAFRYDRATLASIPGKMAVTAIASQTHRFPLYRPAFARGDVSAVDRGNALHLFMQCADYAAAAISVEDEIERLVAGEYIDSALAATINRARLREFFDSELGQKILHGRVLREYAFIDAVDAGTLYDLPPELADQKIMIQGIADCILLEEDGALLIDYKTDRVDTPSELVDRYSGQLALYRAALNKQLPVPVKGCLLYSFALGCTVSVETVCADVFDA